MIVCSCRNISDKEYKNKKDLIKRLHQKDRQCGSCISKNVYDKSIEVNYERQNEKECTQVKTCIRKSKTLLHKKEA